MGFKIKGPFLKMLPKLPLTFSNFILTISLNCNKILKCNKIGIDLLKFTCEDKISNIQNLKKQTIPRKHYLLKNIICPMGEKISHSQNKCFI